MKSSNVLVLIGAVMTLASFFIISGSSKNVDYFYVNGGFSLLVLGSGILIYGLCRTLQDFLKPRLAFVISWGPYLSVMLVSCLLPLFYPFLTSYCWLLIPGVANFFVGYLAGEVKTATKIIIASLPLYTGVAIGLLRIPSVYDAFTSWIHQVSKSPAGYFLSSDADPFSLMLVVFSGYIIMHIILGIGVACVGIAVRDFIGPKEPLLTRPGAILDGLMKLQEQLDRGIITLEEYEQKKKELLE